MKKNNFTMKIAGIPIAVSTLYSETEKLCDAYKCGEQAAFSVNIAREDIERERTKSRQEAMLEGMPVMPWSDAYLETLAVYRKIAAGLLEYDRLLFHGSAVAVDGEGYLFTAKSGTGKSTHTRLWREMLGDRAVMVNDDKPILKIAEEGVLVCGTPWDGKHRLSCNTMVPLKAVCILHRDVENHIEEISVQEAYPMLLQQSFRPHVLHRILKVRKEDYVICGDNCWRREYGITDEQILGVLTAVVRDGKKMPVTDRNYQRYVHLWCDFYYIRAVIFFMRDMLRAIKRKGKKLWTEKKF